MVCLASVVDGGSNIDVFATKLLAANTKGVLVDSESFGVLIAKVVDAADVFENSGHVDMVRTEDSLSDLKTSSKHLRGLFNLV